MNRAETHSLLTFIAAYDNRRFDDATVLAWHPIVAEHAFADCRQAVTAHFASTEAYLMPVHVRRGALELERERKRQQREELEREERLAIAVDAAIDGDPTRRDRSEEVKALIAALRDSLPDGDPDKLRRSEWIEADRRRERWSSAEPNPEYDPQTAFTDPDPDPDQP